jgi:hypothetical protein
VGEGANAFGPTPDCLEVVPKNGGSGELLTVLRQARVI